MTDEAAAVHRGTGQRGGVAGGGAGTVTITGTPSISYAGGNAHRPRLKRVAKGQVRRSLHDASPEALQQSMVGGPLLWGHGPRPGKRTQGVT